MKRIHRGLTAWLIGTSLISLTCAPVAFAAPEVPAPSVGSPSPTPADPTPSVAVSPLATTTPNATPSPDAAASLASPAAAPKPGARVPKPGFRVKPYLQQPSSTAMRINWFSETDTPGTLSINGTTYTSKPEYQPLLEYTQKELDQNIPGLEQGSWLKGNSNYKHSIYVTGLTANTQYPYQVVQGADTFKDSFKTAPTASSWDSVRVIAFSDSETEPNGRIEHREWELSQVNGIAPGSAQRPGAGSAWDKKFGNTKRYGQFTLKYPLDQDVAFKENLKHVSAANPDLIMIPGDLTQGAGYQPAWDEFFTYLAGDNGTLGGHTPFVSALGNWETYAALNNGYGSIEDRTPAVRSRNKYHVYIDTAGDAENPQFKDSYHRVDHGPLTIITLDSTNGAPDENVNKGAGPLLPGKEKFSGNDTNLTPDRLSTDTQGEFTTESYNNAFPQVFPGTTAKDSDLPNFDKDGTQWKWAEKQFADARAKGQIVLVQFHHAAYSNGVHGTPPNHEFPDNQSGVAMRAYTPMFEKYGVAAVISGHDELFERSFVDEDGDGVGFMVYDVGVAADGLRGEQYYKKEDGTYAPIRFNSFSRWSASANQPETWGTDAKGVPQLKDGGLHYGHLQIDLVKKASGAEIVFTPVYVFPLLDSEYNLVKTERRVYDDMTTVHIDRFGRVVSTPAALPTLTLKANQVQQGESLQVNVSGLDPNEKVQAVVHSTPVDLGTKTATAEGTLSFIVDTSALTPGEHTVYINATGANLSQTFTVLTAAAPATPEKPGATPSATAKTAKSGALSTTGSEAELGVLALSLLAAGAGAAALRRRQR